MANNTNSINTAVDVNVPGAEFNSSARSATDLGLPWLFETGLGNANSINAAVGINVSHAAPPI